MLVLSRKVGQKIVIDNQVTITVNRITGGRVSLGISAPSTTRVVRSELGPLDPPTPSPQPAPEPPRVPPTS
jgi:carbon storage regulator